MIFFSCHAIFFVAFLVSMVSIIVPVIYKMSFLRFLSEFAQLSRVEQKIFLFCLRKMRHPRKFTGDVQYIAGQTCTHRKSVEKALHRFNTLPLLRRCVAYVNINVPGEIYRQQKEKSEEERR